MEEEKSHTIPPETAGGGRSHVTRANVLIVMKAALIGLIYGYDLGSIATAILFLGPDPGLSAFYVSFVTTAVVVGQLLRRVFSPAA